MFYKPFETKRKDLVFPRGAGGNFIMQHLNIDAYKEMNFDKNNEYFFNHTDAYKHRDVVIPFYEFLSNSLDLITTMNESVKTAKDWSEGWAVSDLYERRTSNEFSLEAVTHMCHQQYSRIANGAVKGTILFSTRLHNNIISQYKSDGIITCAHHTPDLYAFLHADMHNKSYRDYLNNDLNYYYGFIHIEKSDIEAYNYINRIRSIKHNRDISKFGVNTYEREIEIFPKLFPNCKLFNWRVLFLEFNEDLWEELFVYFDKEQNWKNYKNDIIENVREYTEKNNKLLVDI